MFLGEVPSQSPGTLSRYLLEVSKFTFMVLVDLGQQDILATDGPGPSPPC